MGYEIPYECKANLDNTINTLKQKIIEIRKTSPNLCPKCRKIIEETLKEIE